MAKPTHQDAMVHATNWSVVDNERASNAFNWLWCDQSIPDYATFVKKYPRGRGIS